MNPDLPNNPREELEAQLTALILGELPSEQAFALGRAIEQDADLAKLYERLKQTIQLVRETESSPTEPTAAQPAPLKLSDERRQKLLQQFKTLAPKEFEEPRRRGVRLLELAAAITILGILAAISLPSLSFFRSEKGSISTDTDQTLAGMAADSAVESAKAKVISQIADMENSRQPAAPALETFSPNTPAANTSPSPTNKPSINTIVLPSVDELADAPNAPATSNFTTKHGFALLGPLPSSDPAVLNYDDTKTSLSSKSSKQKETENSFFAGEPQWIGQLEKPSLDRPESDTNRFISGYAYIGVPGGETLDLGLVTNYAKKSDLRALADLLYEPKAPVALSGRDAADFRYFLDLNKNRALDPAGVPNVAVSGGQIGGVAGGGATTASPLPGAVFQEGTANSNLGHFSTATKEPEQIAQNLTTWGAVESGVVSATNSIVPLQQNDLSNSGASALAMRGANTFEGDKVDAFALDEPKAKSTELAGDNLSINRTLGKEILRPGEVATNVYSLGTVGFANVPMQTNFGAITLNGLSSYDRNTFYRLQSQPGTDSNEAQQKAPIQHANPSPIVLPSLQREISKPHEEGRKEVALALAPQPPAISAPTETAKTDTAIPESKPADADASRSYFDAKRNLEEQQQFRQILAMKIEAEKTDQNLPKTMMVQITDPAQSGAVQNPSVWDRLRGKTTGVATSTARIKIERYAPDIEGFSARASANSYDPYFVQGEFEVIQSEAVLGKVIKDLNLNETWAKKHGNGDKLKTSETMGLLKKSLDLRPVPNTSFIEIGAKSDKPDEAAKIANAVAEAYREHRQEQRKQLSTGGIAALEDRWKDQEARVREAQSNVDRLREELKIPDAMVRDAPSTVMSAETLRRIEGMRIESKFELARQETLLNKLKTLGPDKVAAAGLENAKEREIELSPRKPSASAPIPQPELQTHDNPFSTFSLNVSDVSFKLASASLEKGVMPEPSTVRSEEFINAFDYRDPEPPPGVPVAFVWERATYPFAQNRDLLRFSIKTAAQGRQPGRPLNIVLLLDNSGSMERADRVRIIHEALRVLASQLQPQDKFSVVTFSRTARLWVDGVPGDQAAKAAEDLGKLTPEGGTNLEEAMNLAYQTAIHHYLTNGINRVVLLTDGAANLGNVEPDVLKQKVESQRKQGIALDCFGIGWEGFNDDLLEVLSRNGDGRYGFINTPEEAGTEFAGQLAGALDVAASDVKVQVEFNPARVTAYRQIGYAKHQLTKEQFRDNTVDAAEIGAAEAGNALYTVEVNPRGEGPLATVRVRYKVPGTADYHEHEWAVPYTGNAVSLEQASPAMRLAATASAFSEWLVSSPYAGEVTPDHLLGYLSGVPGVYGADARPKKLEWMIRQAKSIAGK